MLPDRDSYRLIYYQRVSTISLSDKVKTDGVPCTLMDADKEPPVLDWFEFTGDHGDTHTVVHESDNDDGWIQSDLNFVDYVALKQL